MDDVNIHIDELVVDDTLPDQIRDKAGVLLVPELIDHVGRAIVGSVYTAAPSEGFPP